MTWGKISTSEDGGRFFVNGSQDVIDRVLEGVPGSKPTKNGGAHVSASPHAAGAMVKSLQGIDIGFDEEWMNLYQMYDSTRHRVETVRNATELPPFESNTKPWLHQTQAYHFLRALPSGALFSDMGTGKTKVVVDLICNEHPRNVLIIGPLKAVEDGLWAREFAKHGSCDVAVHEYGPSAGRINERALWIMGREADQWDKYPVIQVINYETLDKEEMRDALLTVPWDLVVLDESHRIKAVTGVRSKFLGKLGRQVGRRLILTGTPNADKPIDVWGQFRFLDPTIFGNYTEFKRRYCLLRTMPNGSGGYFEKIEGYKNLEHLADEMASVAFRVTADVLDLPEQHDVVRYVRLGRDAQSTYLRMEKACVVQDESFTVIADNVLTRYLRLQEITSGYLRADAEPSDKPGVGRTPREVRRFDTSKADATLEIIEDIGPDEPIIVFYRFDQDAEILAETLLVTGRTCYELSGRRNHLDRWKNSHDPGAVLLVNIAAGAEAIDLTAARYVVYYSTDFSLSHYEQSRKRVHRPGQTRPVTYYHIVAGDTVDQYIQAALHKKQDIATTISEHILAKHQKGA